MSHSGSSHCHYVKILGGEVLVALMGNKLEVKTMDLTGDQRATFEISWNICKTFNATT